MFIFWICLFERSVYGAVGSVSVPWDFPYACPHLYQKPLYQSLPELPSLKGPPFFDLDLHWDTHSSPSISLPDLCYDGSSEDHQWPPHCQSNACLSSLILLNLSAVLNVLLLLPPWPIAMTCLHFQDLSIFWLPPLFLAPPLPSQPLPRVVSQGCPWTFYLLPTLLVMLSTLMALHTIYWLMTPKLIPAAQPTQNALFQLSTWYPHLDV